jgi:phosphosulfolactate synthase
MNLPFLPIRENKPRSKGICMMMDKGLSLQETENIIQAAGHLLDFAKLGFGTSLVTANVKEKVRLYKNAGIKVFAGGTLFEACLIRNCIHEYDKWIETLELDAVEISDGTISISHDQKCRYIAHYASNYVVLSEVGAKEPGVFTDPSEWINKFRAEIEAGSSYVIAEARESGTTGIYDKSGQADDTLIKRISDEISADRMLWEAPLKQQQVWFIKLFGSQVNLGNISPADIIPLETLRLGLRGDTFFDFLPDEFQQYRLK